MKAALSSPALQLLCAALALFAFTWPFLAFDRPLYVFAYFFCTWSAVIGVLFAFSRASDAATAAGDPDPEGDDA